MAFDNPLLYHYIFFLLCFFYRCVLFLNFEGGRDLGRSWSAALWANETSHQSMYIVNASICSVGTELSGAIPELSAFACPLKLMVAVRSTESDGTPSSGHRKVVRPVHIP